MSQKINLNIKKNNDFYVLFTYKVDNISVDFSNYAVAASLYTTDEVTIIHDFNVSLANNGRLILDLGEAEVNSLDINTVYKYKVFLTDINQASVMPFYGDVLVYNDYMSVDQRADYDYINTLSQIIQEKNDVDELIDEAREAAAEAVNATNYALQVANDVIAITVNAIAAANQASVYANNALTYSLNANTSAAEAAANAATANAHVNSALTYRNQANASAQSANNSAISANASAVAANNSKNDVTAMKADVDLSVTNAANSANASANYAAQSAANAVTANTHANTALTYRNQTNTLALAANTSAAAANASALAANTSASQAAASATTANGHQVAANTYKNQANASAIAANTSALSASDSAIAAAGSAVAANTSAVASANSATASANSANSAATSASQATANVATALTYRNQANSSAIAAEASAVAANTSAGAASGSATAAATSATNANTSANSAAASAALANTHQVNANTYKNQASVSATAAADSASLAANSATASANSAAASSGSATAAAASAALANTSAAAASGSESAAAGSAAAAAANAVTANTHANTALTHALAANTSRSQAAGNATAAAASATAAATSATQAAGNVAVIAGHANNALTYSLNANTSAAAAAGSAAAASGSAAAAATSETNANTSANAAANAANVAMYYYGLVVNAGNVIVATIDEARMYANQANASAVSANNSYNNLLALSNASPVNGTIPIRTGTGTIKATNPAANDDLVTLAYANATYIAKSGAAVLNGTLTVNGSTITLKGTGNRSVWFQDSNNVNRGVVFHDDALNRITIRPNMANGSSGANFHFTVDGKLLNGTSEYYHEGNFNPNNYATLASPTLTGDPKAPTNPYTDNDTSIATTGFVHAFASAFGLGKVGPSKGLFDLNSADIGSFISVGGTALDGKTLNWPDRGAADTASEWWNVITYGGSATRVTQIASHGLTSGSSATFVRTQHDSTWTAWRKIAFLDESVSRSGDTMTGVLSMPTGSAGTPAVNFGTLNSGVWGVGTNVHITASGTTRFSVNTSAITATPPVRGPNGSVGSPTFSFTTDINTGVYTPGADILGFVVGGVETFRVTTNNVSVNTQIKTTSPAPVAGDDLTRKDYVDGVATTVASDAAAATAGLAARNLTAGDGIIGGGNLTADRSFAVQANNGLVANATGLYVVQGTDVVVNTTGVHVGTGIPRTTRLINTGNGLTGGGNLTADRTLSVQANSGLVANATGLYVLAGTDIVSNATGVHVGTGVVRTSRRVIAGNGVLGGGALSGDVSIYVPASNGLTTNATGLYLVQGTDVVVNTTGIHVGTGVVRTTRNVTTGNGLTGGGNLTADRTLSVVAGNNIVANATGVHVQANPTFTGNVNMLANSFVKGAREINLSATATSNVVGIRFFNAAGVESGVVYSDANAKVTYVKAGNTTANASFSFDANGIFTSPGNVRVYDSVIVSPSTTNTSNNAHLFYYNRDGVEKGIIWCDTGTGTVNIRANGSPTFAFTYAGDFVSPGDITAFSDERLKTNIRNITGKEASEIILNISGKRYIKDGKETIGVIAQEVEKVAPELVIENDSSDDKFASNGERPTLSVSTGNGFTALLIETIKHMNKKIDSLEKRIDELEKSNR